MAILRGYWRKLGADLGHTAELGALNLGRWLGHARCTPPGPLRALKLRVGHQWGTTGHTGDTDRLELQSTGAGLAGGSAR